MGQQALALALLLATSCVLGLNIDLDDVYFDGDDGWSDLTAGVCNTGSTNLPGWERVNLKNATYSGRVRDLVLLAAREYLADNPDLASSCTVDEDGDIIDVDVNYACQKVSSDGVKMRISFDIDCVDAPDLEDNAVHLGASFLLPTVGEPTFNVSRKEVTCSRFDSNNVECYFGGMRELECESSNPMVMGDQVSLTVRCEVYARGDDRLPEYAFSCPATAVTTDPGSFTLDCNLDPSIPDDARSSIITILDNWQALERPADFYRDTDRDHDDDDHDDDDDDDGDWKPTPSPTPTPIPTPPSNPVPPSAGIPASCDRFDSTELECYFGGAWELECETLSSSVSGSMVELSIECDVYSRSNTNVPIHTFMCQATAGVDGSNFDLGCNPDPTMPADIQAGVGALLNSWEGKQRGPNFWQGTGTGDRDNDYDYDYDNDDDDDMRPMPNPVPVPVPVPPTTGPSQFNCETFVSNRLECYFGGSFELECEPRAAGTFECDVYSRSNDNEPIHVFFCQNSASALTCNLDPTMPADMQAGVNEILNAWQSVVR